VGDHIYAGSTLYSGAVTIVENGVAQAVVRVVKGVRSGAHVTGATGSAAGKTSHETVMGALPCAGHPKGPLAADTSGRAGPWAE